MPYFRERPLVFWSFALAILLGGCDSKSGPQCDSSETRNAVLQAVSNDRDNALAKYAAAENSDAAKAHGDGSEAGKSQQQPKYLLDDEMVTVSTSDHKRTLKCSGALSVTVGDTTASKEVNFTVQQSSDGKLTVAVEPFQF
jgi:hypothetical protein